MPIKLNHNVGPIMMPNVLLSKEILFLESGPENFYG